MNLFEVAEKYGLSCSITTQAEEAPRSWEPAPKPWREWRVSYKTTYSFSGRLGRLPEGFVSFSFSLPTSDGSAEAAVIVERICQAISETTNVPK